MCRPFHDHAFAMVLFSQSDWVEAEMAARRWTPDWCYPGYGGCVLRAGHAGFRRDLYVDRAGACPAAREPRGMGAVRAPLAKGGMAVLIVVTAWLRAYVAAWNDHGVDVIVDLYDVGARRVSPVGALEGRDAIRSFVQGLFAMSPDTTIELGRTAENHNDVLFEFVDRGTHQIG